MAQQLYSSTSADPDGRCLLLDDTVLSVMRCSPETEAWDRTPVGASWYEEVFRPTDLFNAATVQDDRWGILNTSGVGGSVSQTGGKLTASVQRAEGVAGLTSEEKWKLKGDFDIRLYIDWDSYYNEYRSITNMFLQVAVSADNAARLCFRFDGSQFSFSAESTVGRDPRYFGWSTTGSRRVQASFSAATAYRCLKITRTSGVIRMFMSTGAEDTAVGGGVSDGVFAGDVYVSLGVETEEYNSARLAFSEFILFAGELAVETEFFAANRGRRREFPENVIVVVSAQEVSLIDEGTSKLWARCLVAPGLPLAAGVTAVAFCEGALYCATPAGLVVLDFVRDKLFRYSGSAVQVADEPVALRNAEVTFRDYLPAYGTFPSSAMNDVAARNLFGNVYVAAAHQAGVSVFRPLVSGVATCADTPVPATVVELTPAGSLFWAGYDQDNTDGAVSYYSSVTTLVLSGTSSFARSGYYGPGSAYPIFGNTPQTISVLGAAEDELLAVGTEAGVTLVVTGPALRPPGAYSFGVPGTVSNPVVDPSFENYLGLDWKVRYSGLHQVFFATREPTFTAVGGQALRLGFSNLLTSERVLEAGLIGQVYQDVDLTGVRTLYFDCKVGNTSPGPTTNALDFEAVVGGVVVKTYHDTDGPIVRLTDSIDVSQFTGIQRLSFRWRALATGHVANLSQRVAWVDNIRTSVGVPMYEVLPEGNASILEVLLQYEPAGRKIYFTSAGGYGALDLSTNSLDYFIPITNYLPTAAITTADFVRVDES